MINENFDNKQPIRKKGKTGAAIAFCAAVAVIGCGAGFGGAYLTGIRDGVNTSVNAPGDDLWSDPDDSPANSDEQEVNEDIASAIDAINTQNTAEPDKEMNATAVTATGPNGEYTNEELFEAVDDTIVLINIYKTSSGGYNDFYNYYFGYGDEPDEKDSEPELAGYGSGIIFTDDGYVLTNQHVTEGASKLEVVVNDYGNSGKTNTYEAKVIGEDADTDIAVIKISRKEKFRAAKIGDSDTLKVGQDVCAIGNPGVYGMTMFAHTMTKGIISGLGRAGSTGGYSTTYIQTDTAINSGNSGGALFDMYGNVVGVVNRKIVASQIENIGFAITINEAKPIMEDLLAYGYVKSRPVLGVTTSALNEARAQLYGTKLSKGLLVTSIREDAAVSRSELQLYDIITKVNGKNVESVTDVQSIIKDMKAGDKITVTVAREREDGSLDSIDIEIELSESTNNN